MKKKFFFNILRAIHSNNISEILILFAYFRNMYPCHRCLRQYLKHALINYLEILRKNGDFALSNTLLEPYRQASIIVLDFLV